MTVRELRDRLRREDDVTLDLPVYVYDDVKDECHPLNATAAALIQPNNKPYVADKTGCRLVYALS